VEIIPFGIYSMRKEKTKYQNYYRLFFSREIPERFSWKISQKFSLSLTKNKDLILQLINLELLKKYSKNPQKDLEIIDLRDTKTSPGNVFIEIPERMIKEIKPKKGQRFSFWGLRNNRLLITKFP